MSIERKVVHEIKVNKSLLPLLWVLVIGVVLSLPLSEKFIPNAFAELASNPEITLLIGEIDPGSLSNKKSLDIDD